MSRYFAIAADTLSELRRERLRSLLSILGLVIGVAALLSILALADGLEAYARDQIGTTTDLQNVTVAPRTTDQVDGVQLRRSRVPEPTRADAAALGERLGSSAVVALAQRWPAEVTGIAVLVGGVGVMNVLLMSVTERTREIGIRKAVGARRRDILAQFLAEAMLVAGGGSLVGMMVGLAGIFALMPVVRAVAQVPFQAAVTWGTLLVVCGVALAVGVVFGTYPAARAARLSPVDAMRHE